jgi:hypothetical protein
MQRLEMAANFPARCLSFLMAVAKAIFKFDVPTGYQDDNGFHWNRD